MVDAASPLDVQPKALRLYDKGERRFKHVGKTEEAEIAFESGNPRRWVGKCPCNLSQAQREQLLNEAMPAANGDRELSFVKKPYVVHEGAIYEAQTSDGGQSYHGYPYKGRISGAMLAELRKMAERKECLREFNVWVKKHIVLHGGDR